MVQEGYYRYGTPPPSSIYDCVTTNCISINCCNQPPPTSAPFCSYQVNGLVCVDNATFYNVSTNEFVSDPIGNFYCHAVTGVCHSMPVAPAVDNYLLNFLGIILIVIVAMLAVTVLVLFLTKLGSNRMGMM